VLSASVFPAFAKSHKSSNTSSSQGGLARLPSNAADYPVC
jgi:hypothetical protein